MRFKKQAIPHNSSKRTSSSRSRCFGDPKRSDAEANDDRKLIIRRHGKRGCLFSVIMHDFES